MAIEPLSSVMTFQAQDAPKPKVELAQPVDMEVSSDDQAVKVDTTTASVARTQEEDSEAGKDSGKGNDSNGNQQAKNIPQPNTDYLKKAIEEMNRKINNTNEEAIFGVHEDTNRIMIKIVDKDTKEIIKEFPPEKTLDMIAKVWEMAGLLVDEKR